MRTRTAERRRFRGLGRRGKVAKLARALDHHDMMVTQNGRAFDVGTAVREKAVRKLAGIPGQEALEALVRALEDRDDGVRRSAVVAVAGREDEQAVPALAAACGSWLAVHPDRETLRTAVDALVQAGDPRTVEWAGAAMIARPRSRPLGPGDERLALELLRSFGAGRAADGLAEHAVGELASERPEVRERAGTVLGWLGPASYDPLLRGLDDDRLAPECALLLARVGDARAVTPLARLLTRTDPEVRVAATVALGELRTLGAVNALMGAVNDSDPMVRRAALEALERLGPAAVVAGIARIAGPVRKLLTRNGGDAPAAPVGRQLSGALRLLGSAQRRRGRRRRVLTDGRR